MQVSDRFNKGIKMKFGICYNVDYQAEVHGSPADYYESILDQCVLLEELGFDSAWFSEHHSGPYSFGNPALMIATAATRTRRLKLGTGVSLLPLHHPIVLSEEYAMLDQLTGGRLEYGVGRGYLLHEYPWLNIPLDESAPRYREALDFIIQAWTTKGKMSFEGEFFKVDGYKPFPNVVQQPMPRIFASAVSAESFAYAASKNLDIGVAIFVPGMNELLPGYIAEYESALADHGFARSDRQVMGITQMYCAEDPEEALAEGCRYAENYFKFFGTTMIESGGPNPVAEYMMQVKASGLNDLNQTLFGTPEELSTRSSGCAGI